MAIRLAELANPETREKLNDSKYQIPGNVLPLAVSVYSKGYTIIAEEPQITVPEKIEPPQPSVNRLKSLFERKKQNSISDIKLEGRNKEPCSDNTEFDASSQRNSLGTAAASEDNSLEMRRLSDASESSVPKKRFYYPKEKSRFGFVLENNEKETKTGDQINEIICKTLSTRFLLKYIDQNIKDEYTISIIEKADKEVSDFICNINAALCNSKK